jgi:hypothetical protein
MSAAEGLSATGVACLKRGRSAKGVWCIVSLERMGLKELPLQPQPSALIRSTSLCAKRLNNAEQDCTRGKTAGRKCEGQD